MKAFVKATLSMALERPTTAVRRSSLAGFLHGHLLSPRLRFAADRGDWLMLCFDVAPGHTAQEPWDPAELAAVLDTLSSCAEHLTPSPIPDAGTVAERMAGRCGTWRSLATRGEIDGVILTDLNSWERSKLPRLASLEDSGQQYIDDTTLLHFDLQADNCLISLAGSVSFVDWGRACTAPPGSTSSV